MQRGRPKHPDILTPREWEVLALLRDGASNDEIAARQRDQAAAADNYTLTEARYREGIDPFLTVLVAQRSYYSAQQTMVQTKLTAAQNLVTIYRSIGCDTLLQRTPVCQALTYDTNAAAKPAPLCTP